MKKDKKKRNKQKQSHRETLRENTKKNQEKLKTRPVGKYGGKQKMKEVGGIAAAYERENLKIVDRFYDIYDRAPRREEFTKCGGKLSRVYGTHSSYQEWLRSHNYEAPGWDKTYEVYDAYDFLIFTATSETLADEFGYAPRTIRRLAAAGKRTKSGLLFKHKPFDEKEWNK